MRSPPALSVDHSCRIPVLESEKRWSLRGDVLWISEGAYPPFPIPLGSPTEIRLSYYTELVRLLTMRTATLNPYSRFVTGTSWPSWLFQTGFLSAMLLLLGWVFLNLGSPIPSQVLLKLLILLLYIPLAGAWIVKNKPWAFAPSQVPETLLPAPA